MIQLSGPAARLLLGDEAAAWGALDAGVSVAYGYPGTPSTEIFEFVEREGIRYGVTAHWTANEKSAYEAALGVSMVGRRVLVSMKHVGLAAYPLPVEKLADLAGRVERILVLEEGYPFIERQLRGLLPSDREILGRESGAVPPTGELTPEAVRDALGLQPRAVVRAGGLPLPDRPPQLTPLLDAVVHDTDMTVLILDNETVAMTGQQSTLLPSSRIVPLLQGLGVHADHLHVVETHPKRTAELADVLRSAMEHRGLSVVVAIRECVEVARHRKRDAGNGSAAASARDGRGGSGG